MLESDLGAALWRRLARSADERPQAIVVLSDGRLDRPAEIGTSPTRPRPRSAASTSRSTRSRSRKPSPARREHPIGSTTAGAAVAHQPLSLRVEVGCEHLDCADVPIVARELREQGKPVVLAQGTAHVVNGSATIELTLTIDRAGARILEVEIEPPPGDTIPENNRRFIALDVTRDRVRLLHVAGPVRTYDIVSRALRMWAEERRASVDVVAFFILRAPNSDVHVPQSRQDKEMALIPFPARELFTEHLPSFDAVILQDMDIGSRYQVDSYVPNLARYVEQGGGLIVVGGAESFVAGHYAGTAIARALPVDLDPHDPPSDLAFFTPRFTPAGRFAPVLAPLRALIGEEFPEMPGANIVGDARSDATVLHEDPWRPHQERRADAPAHARRARQWAAPSRSSVDGSHRLLFSAFAASAAGRAHGAFWDAMLGWLMRDPRFEPAAVDVKGGCIAGEPSTLVLRPLPDQKGHAVVKILRLGTGEVDKTLEADLNGDGAPIELAAGSLEPGGYSAAVEIGAAGAKGPTTKRDFACETGGDEWADSRPDTARLKAIARATGGTYALASDASSIPMPAAKEIAAERKVSALLPAWAWAAFAAFLLGAHWIVRRSSGLA